MRTLHTIYYSTSGGHGDIISTLPDDLRGRIVSFLPTKEAVATSVLSRRWIYVWASSPILDFDFSLFPRKRGRKTAFTEFVSRALVLFDGKLKKFRVSLEGYEAHEPRLEEWVSFAVNRDVEEIELCLPKGGKLKIPDEVFSCGSLRVLTLKMCNYFSELPSPEGLAMLKKLHLVSISLMKGRFIRELFANCLLLEDLVIEECKMDALEFVAPRLERLALDNCDWIHPIEIKISAPSLQFFSYSGRVADDHCMENLTLLNEAQLELNAPSTLFKADDDSKLCLIKIVQALSNARSLTLSCWCTEYLSRAPRLLKWLHLHGGNLKNIELGMWYNEDSVRVIATLLRSFPGIETLEVHINIYRSIRISKGSHCDGGEQQYVRIKGLAKNLKDVKLVYIDRCNNGIHLVKFLLENARSLQKMSIVSFIDGLEHAKFRRKISTFKKASRSVKVEHFIST